MADSKVEEAVEFLKLSEDAFSTIRAEGMDDLRFSYGDQWPVEQQNSRKLENRPCLTVNKLDAYIRQVTNGQRQQRPRIDVHPVDSFADPKIAKVIKGITRHIEVNSNADHAYDLAFDFAVRAYVGYFRLRADYCRPDSFDQDIYIDAVVNPWSVRFDPMSELPDGSDQKQCLITDEIKRDLYRKLYPGSEACDFEPSQGDDRVADWVQKETIRVAEYYYIRQTKDRLVAIADMNGNVRQGFASKLGASSIDEAFLTSIGQRIIGDRPTLRNEVKWCKVNGVETLEERDIPGQYIPVVPVYGTTLIVDGKKKIFGMVRMARDPQLMYNYWATTATESVAMAPKAKWLIPEGTDEGYENDFAAANTSTKAVLRYKPMDLNGQPGKPERIQPEPPPEGILTSLAMVSQDLQSVLGIFDPAIGKPQNNDKSGKAIKAEQAQSDESNFHYFDNLTQSIKHAGRIILGWIPTYYDRQRVVRIIGDDGKPDMLTVNQPGTDANGIQRVLNDVTIGTYDVVMDSGPGYQTQRQESVEMMLAATKGYPKLWEVAGDLIFRNSDFPGAEVIADRLAATNPLAGIDDKSEIPPRVQMQIMQLQKQLQDAEGVIAHAKQDLEQRIGVKMAELSAQGQIEMAKIAAEERAKQAEIRAEMIQAQQATQLEIFQAEQVDKSEMAKKEYEERIRAATEHQKMLANAAIEEHKAQLAAIQADADRKFDAWKTLIDGEVKVMIAGMGAAKSAPAKDNDGDADKPKESATAPELAQMTAAIADAIAGFREAVDQMSKVAGAERELVRDPVTGRAKGMRLVMQ
jgi:hypothetical protein